MSDESLRAVDELCGLLTVEEIDTDLYRGAPAPEGPGRVFGGQVVAQALASAALSVGETQQSHSLHGYFLRAGDTTRPIIYRVARDFDGGSFSNRRVVATQGGVPILNLAASFHRHEEGFSHAATMPDVLPPQECPDLASALTASGQPFPPIMLERLTAFEVRPGPPSSAKADGTGMPSQYLWFKLAHTLEPNPALQRVILAYASDFALVTTTVLPHGISFFSPRLQVASLDHAMWFHSTPPVDDWLVYAMESPWAGHARGFSRGAFFTREGTLVASVAQEGLCRLRPDRS